MRSVRIPLLAMLAALPLGLSGCYEKTQPMDPVSSLSQDGAGGVAFRLSAADLAGLGVAVDSVRIEAERAGFPSRFATGSLQQQVELSDLAAGTWNLKVALYDNVSQIHLYGEVLVQVQPGRSVDAEVRLRRATGSVRVHIVIDDSLPTGRIDTLQVEWGNNMPSWKPVKYWRTAEGVYLVSTLVESCFTPYVTFGEPARPLTQSLGQTSASAARSALIAILPSQLVLGSNPTGATVCPNLYQERTKFIPWTAPGPLTLYVPGDSIVLADPVLPPPPVLDTIKLTPIKADSAYGVMEKLPVLGAWRDDRGVFIATRYDCNGAPQVVETDMFTMSSGVVRFTPVRSGMRTKMGCGEARHILFVPTSYAGAHQVADATNGMFYDLPGIVVPPKDSSAVVYRLNILRTDSVSVAYELTMDGTLHRTITSPISVVAPQPYLMVDSYTVASKPRVSTLAPLPQVGSATSDALIFLGSTLRDSIQKILDQPDVRGLVGGLCLPLPIRYRGTLAQDAVPSAYVKAPAANLVMVEPLYLTYKRHVVYADGKTIDWDLYNSPCSSVTDRLSPVDQILTSALPPDGN